MIYIYSKVGAGLLNVESDEPLNGLTVQDCSGAEVNAPVIREQFEDGKHLYTLDASRLQCWSPNHPRLYVLQAGEVRQRFGYCELSTLDNRAVLLNGVPLYLRGCIRGIVAHDHPNMTGGTLRDAAVKYIRQAKKYGFNLVRFHSNVPSPEFVEAADEEGILIHLETGFSYEFDRVGTMKKLSMDNARWTETLLAYRNNPSLAIFCIGNEMHNSGHQPEVHKLYAEGRKLAPSKLMVDNSGWGEYDRPCSDIYLQHIAYYYPFKHHGDMFVTDACWRMNGSTYDTALDERSECAAVSAEIRREAVPLRPVLAHEAIHYIEIPDYDELNRKFDAFCARVGDKYLADNEISRPRYFTELPRLIQRKNLTAKMPDYIQGSRIFKQMGIKTYLERLRLSQLCGYEMLQFADCLKYENKNGIVDFFDDDKYFDADWMNTFNGDGAILAEFENETFYYDEAVKMILFASDFLEHPVQRGTVEVRVDGELVWCGRDVTLAGNLQKIAEVTLRFKERTQPAKATVAASFTSGDVKLENSWSLWLYPRVSVTVPAEVEVDDAEAKAFFNAGGNSCSGPFITDKLNDRVFEQLESGRHVLLLYHRDRPGNQYYLPGALERFKPCIWDRGSNLGGFFSCGILSQAVGGGRYFEANMQPLLEAAYKVNLDKCTLPVQEHINGIDKPVRDRMKGLVDGIKDFIDDDTLRNFSHCFSISLENGAVLTVCTLNFNAAAVTRNFHAALINNLDAFKAEEMVSISRLRQYVQESTDAGICREDVMNHFWEIDNKPVEDTLFWEATGLDLSKLK